MRSLQQLSTTSASHDPCGHNIQFLIKCIDDSITFGSRLMHSRTKLKSIRSLNIENRNNAVSGNADCDNSDLQYTNFADRTLFHNSVMIGNENKARSFGRCDINYHEVTKFTALILL